MKEKSKINGIIPNLVLNLNGTASPNEYSDVYLEILYSNSNKNPALDGILDITYNNETYKPSVSQTEKITNEECSFQISNPNGRNNIKLAVNSPYFNGIDASTQIISNPTQYTCFHITNNETLFLTDGSTEISGDFYKTATAAQTIFSFDSYDGNQPFKIDINHTIGQNSGSITFENNPTNNPSNNGYDIKNIYIEPCVNGQATPYIKYNGSWHGETNCLASINIDLASNPTANAPFSLAGFTPYIPFTPDPNAPQDTPRIALIINQNANANSTQTNQYFDANGHLINVNIGSTTNDNDHILLDSIITPQANTMTVFDNQGLPISDQSPDYSNKTIITPEDQSKPMTTSNIIVLPCDNKRPFIWIIKPDGSLEAMNKTICDANNEINIIPAAQPTINQLWKVQENNSSNTTHYVAYLLFKGTLFETHCLNGLCPENKIFNSLYRPGWIRLDYGTDRHGVYYEDKSNDVSIAHLDEMQMINDGVVIKKIELMKDHGKKYTLVRLESDDHPIIFNKDTFDISNPTYTLVNSEQINLTADGNFGPHDPEQKLYIVDKIIDNINHTLTTTIEEGLSFVNFDANDSIKFSIMNFLN